jgi:hypothetical protein
MVSMKAVMERPTEISNSDLELLLRGKRGFNGIRKPLEPAERNLVLGILNIRIHNGIVVFRSRSEAKRLSGSRYGYTNSPSTIDCADVERFNKIMERK